MASPPTVDSKDTAEITMEPLNVNFRDRSIPVSHPSVSREIAVKALESEPFVAWLDRCSKPSGSKQLELEAIELQSVDLFGTRVGFIKLKSVCKLRDGNVLHPQPLPGICFLRGNAVSILVALCCDDGNTYSLLVEQPRIPVGQVSILELPAGMLDQDGGVAGVAAKEMEEECGITIKAEDLIDLTLLAGHDEGMCPSAGGCDEYIRLMYLEKRVTTSELQAMKGRLTGLRQHGEIITLRVVPFNDVWKVTTDAKAMCSLFLVDQLRTVGKLRQPGEFEKTLLTEPTLTMSNGVRVPQLAFGLYKIPNSDEGERIILDAVRAGYRHFDTATFYGNEATLGRALKKSGLKREEFFICSKVWNDAQKQGRAAVHESVEESLEALDFGGYFDLFLIHWPVPGCFVASYKELEILHWEGKLRSLGLSNFTPEEYAELTASGVQVAPVVNQMEVSPVMYRPSAIEYFIDRGILVSAFKPLHRGGAFDRAPIPDFAAKYSKTPAQIMLRWGLQKGLIVVAKTSSRMEENRDILDFELSDQEMKQLDALTTEEDIREREELEVTRKTSL